MRGKGILIDDNYALAVKAVRGTDGRIVSGLRIGNTLYQNQALLLSFRPGSLKSAPVVGVGIADALLDHDFLGWRRRIRQQLELDGQKVTSVAFSSNQPLTIDAEYSNS